MSAPAGRNRLGAGAWCAGRPCNGLKVAFETPPPRYQRQRPAEGGLETPPAGLDTTNLIQRIVMSKHNSMNARGHRRDGDDLIPAGRGVDRAPAGLHPN